MRQILVACLVTAAVAVSAGPAYAEPVVLLVGPASDRHVARLESLETFREHCRPSSPPSGPLLRVPGVEVHTAGELIDVLRGAEDPDGNIFLVSTLGAVVPRDSVCRADPTLNEMLYSAPAAPRPRTAWTVFWVAIGILAVAIALVAATGRGVGPAPVIEAAPDPHAHEEPDEPGDPDAHTEPGAH